MVAKIQVTPDRLGAARCVVSAASSIHWQLLIQVVIVSVARRVYNLKSNKAEIMRLIVLIAILVEHRVANNKDGVRYS